MGIRVFVFDEAAAPGQVDRIDWVRGQIVAGSKDAWESPATSSQKLRSWFGEIERDFPLLKDAHADDPYGTEYCFYTNVIDVVFASSVGEEGVVGAWKLADKFQLRLLVGDQLLPKAAPAGKRNFHISVLDGRGFSKKDIQSNMCLVVFDSHLMRSSSNEIQKWVLEQLSSANWSADPSILGTELLRKWYEEFTQLGLSSMMISVRFFREFVFICLDEENTNIVMSATMKLSHKLHLPFVFFEAPSSVKK